MKNGVSYSAFLFILGFLVNSLELNATHNRGPVLFLELDGVVVAQLSSAAGGDAEGIVVSEPSPNPPTIKKHIADVKYNEITMQLELPARESLLDWIKGFMEGSTLRKNGAIISCDFNYIERTKREFTEALITEVSFPKLDSSSKDAAYITVTMLPNFTIEKKGSGGKITAPPRKKWLAANFRLEIDKIDTTRVRKIDALTIKQKVVENPVGEQHNVIRVPGTLEYPNLVVYVPEMSAQSFKDWHQSFVIEGNNGDEKELSGSLEYLTPSGVPLFDIPFHGLGIFRFKQDDQEAQADNIRRVRAEIYTENMRFNTKKASIWASNLQMPLKKMGNVVWADRGF